MQREWYLFYEPNTLSLLKATVYDRTHKIISLYMGFIFFFMNIIINCFTRFTIESKHYIQCTVTLLIHQICNTVIINIE